MKERSRDKIIPIVIVAVSVMVAMIVWFGNSYSVENNEKLIDRINQNKQSIKNLENVYKKAVSSLLAIDLLALETKGKFGTAGDKKAREEMFAFYNIILNTVVSDEKELSEEIKNLQNLIKSISEKEPK